ncbi:MAG: histidine kinase [Chitinophagaceae bacterium]|nr:histidine kinase [Chitinophagaceae bacterium]
MKRIILPAVCCLSFGAFGQRYGYIFDRTIHFEFVSTDTRMMVRQPATFTARDWDVDGVWDFMKATDVGAGKDKVPKSPLFLGVKLDSSVKDYYGTPIKSISRSYTSYLISDSSPAILIAMGINKDNISDYIYHVVENDSVETIPWSKIPRLEQQYGAKRPYGFVGQFQAPGRQLVVEVRSVKDYNIRDGVVFDWRKDLKPVVSQMIINVPEDASGRIPYFNVNYPKMNRGWATKFDKQTGLPLNFAFPVDSVEQMRLMFGHHESVGYSVYLIKKTPARTDTTAVRMFLLEDFVDIEKKYFNEPGKYEIIIQRMLELGAWPEDQMLRIPFEVQPPPVLDKRVSVKQALPYLGATLGGVALLFLSYRRVNKNKLARSLQARQSAQLQLKSVRSQLNPHFMFNALTSIQNLMNKNDTKAANHYLAKFADLTREVLDGGDRELISLEDELKILDDYLQMEQLRFGFQYHIIVDGGINIANTEVPGMLLQPFVENAVKHGVAPLHGQGTVRIRIDKDNKDLVLKVTDDGRGFNKADIAGKASAFGIKLSEERILLLNKVYKGQPSSLHIEPGAEGTTVTVRLANWMA